MEVKVAEVEGVHVVSVEGELSRLTTIALFQQIVGLRVRPGTRIVLDLHGVTYLDSTGSGQLWRTVESARTAGGRAVLAAAPPVVRRTLDLVGISARVPMAATVEEAVRSLATPGGDGLSSPG